VITRLLAAFVGLAVLIPALIFGGVPAVDLIVALVGVAVVSEYAAMAFPGDTRVAGLWLLGCLGLTYGVALYVDLAAWGPALLLVFLASMAAVTFRPGEELGDGADRYARLVAGIGWLGLLTFIPLLRRLDDGLGWVFLVLAISWCGDTGGYFAGKYLGKRKLYPRISPKKTWMGVFGGMALAVVGVFGVRALGLPQLTPLDCVALGIVMTAAGVVGDLSESMLKRAFDVKDSGWLMPGHGGLLDRIDSVLFVAPLVYVYAMVMA